LASKFIELLTQKEEEEKEWRISNSKQHNNLTSKLDGTPKRPNQGDSLNAAH